MEIVQQFNAELSSLYEVRPPISKAKMSQITRVSMKAVKMYKHIVQSVERFIVKCRPEYKIPGLYVIDSIVRQSRHQFGIDKDVYAPRFARNFQSTFQNLFLTCPPDDKPKIVRVLNLWQRNNVFSAENIQPLLDMANPNAALAQMKFESSSPTNQTSRDTARDNRDSNPALKDTNLMLQLQQLANSLGLVKSGNSSSANFSEAQQMEAQNTIKFNKKLLDFDYGDEEDEDERGETPTEAEPPLRSGMVDDNNVTNPLALSMAQNLLSNPELLQQLQQMQKTIQQTELLKLSISELESHGLSDLNQSALNTTAGQQFLSAFQSQQNQTINDINNDEKRNELISFENMEQKLNNENNNINSSINNETNFQYLQNANFGPQLRANDINFALNNSSIDAQQQYQQQQQPFHQQYNQDITERSGSQSPRSRSPRRSRFNRYRERSRSRSPRNRRDRDNRDSRRSYRSRSRSPRNSRFNDSRNDRSRSPASYERERERERRRKGLPPLRKACLTICSTTLWLGHVPKLVSEADLSDTFGEFGAINSIDLIPSRGCAYVCMNRRQDAAKALNNLRNMKLHGSLIKMAWAPGKGMKGKEFKDYWEADHGASYIPYNKLPEEVDLDLLEEGGTVDDDTVPEKLQELRKRKNKEREEQEREAAAALMARAALIPMPMVQIPNSSFGVTGLVMPPNMLLPQTGQTPVISLQSSTDGSMLSTVTTTSFPQMPTNMIPVKANEENITSHSSDRNDIINEIHMNTDNSQSNDNKNDFNLTSNNSGPLLPPPLPPFQAPLGMPPLPPIIGGQPPPRMPWLSGPPPPIMPGNRMPVNTGVSHRPPLLQHSSSSTSTTNTTITSFRPEDIPPRPSMAKPEDRPPLIATLPPLPIPHEELPPRLHPERNFSSRDRFRPNLDRPELDRPHPNDDPFAPSVYELRAMERNSMMRPPIPHQMPSGRSGLMQMTPNMSERFPFERHQRPYHPRHHNIRPNLHHNYDRHSNHGNHQQNRGSGRDQYSNRGNFNRRDRPSRWKSDDRQYNRNNNNNNNNNNNSDYNTPFNVYDKQHHHQQSDENNDSFHSNNNNNSNNDLSIGESDNNPINSEFDSNSNNNNNNNNNESNSENFENFSELETNT